MMFDADPKIPVVLGHFNSSCSLAAAKSQGQRADHLPFFICDFSFSIVSAPSVPAESKGRRAERRRRSADYSDSMGETAGNRLEGRPNF
jgi:hypothetical protein